MPELPEVEYVSRALGRAIVGRSISVAELRRPRLAPETKPERFASLLSGSVVGSVSRRGKYILIELNNGRTLIVHLRMSGRFLLLSDDDSDPKFAHAVFHFEGSDRLVFEDQRHFGLMKVVSTAKVFHTKEIACLAPEPLSEDFFPDCLAAVLKASNRSLKEVLLDQTKVCGIGNIYASEALFLARISPRRRANNLGTARIQRLFQSIRAVLSDAIAVQALVEPHPVVIGEGIYGLPDDRWRVYDREGAGCVTCSTPIRRIRQAGRSTYYCPKCQR